ncbi:putative xaa-pro dipeptidase app [Phaeomoniella chlamydospora]|uniref:Xaa-Pro aminopeptidase n=1 Tax=Phaeomoniella chlamydospora TaxID=158046 RepID=A0A0G2E445_PHACM|nr:putative xaa-pro dipeptidase app [Phaeomoniella chlamydospora]
MRLGNPSTRLTHICLSLVNVVTPGITALEYAQRRSRLAAKLPNNAIAVVAASDIQFRSGGVFYEFHQDPDFFYLTGFNEPEALAVIAKSPHEDDHIFHLYVREKDPKAEIWDGARSGTIAARDVFNADETGDVARLKDVLPAVVGEVSQVYTDITTSINKSVLSRFLHGKTSARTEGFASLIDSSKIRSLRPVINDLRIIKSEAEISNMRAAGRYSGRAFTEAMRHTPSLQTEAALDAYLEYQFRVQGCSGPSFEPVVASGVNALSIHYVRNDDVLHPEKLVLVDGGGSYGGYISDITRAYPASGKFSTAQKDLYEAILSVQRSCVSMCRESAKVSLDKLHDIAEAGLKENLKSLGFDVSGRDTMSALFPHHLGHYIGLDVHDCAGFSRRNNLIANQCVTIEPGIYVPTEDDDRFPVHFRGMGIRIEDSVAVGEDNPFVLTTEAVKEVADIEALQS